MVAALRNDRVLKMDYTIISCKLQGKTETNIRSDYFFWHAGQK
jgi:hypothetical protein